MKKGVVIGASKDSIHTIKVAKELGIYVIALDGNANADGFNFADEKVVVDISNQSAVIEEIEKLSPDFIIPIPIGRYLSTTGYVNEHFNFKGVKYTATQISTDKHLFHERLKDMHLREISHYLITPKQPIVNYKLCYPAIIKPRFGSGSRDVYFVNDEEELMSKIPILNKQEDFIVEDAVQGIEYSVDGAVIDGKLHITLLRKKLITPIPCRQPISSFSVVKNSDNEALFNRVFKKLSAVVSALEYNDCLINADLIINSDDVFLIEIAPRPSGHNLHDVFVPHATGIDIAKEYINFLLGKECCFETNDIKCLQIRFFDFENVIITKVPSDAELYSDEKSNIRVWNCHIKVGDEMHKVENGHSIMGRGFFIVEGENEEDLICQSEYLLSKFEYERV